MNPQQQVEMNRLKSEVSRLRMFLRDIISECQDARGEGPVTLAEAIEEMAQDALGKVVTQATSPDTDDK